MEKYIFYETNKSVGFCPSREWGKYMYENRLTPIREAIVTATSEGIEELLLIYNEDTELFIEMIRQELDENFTTTYNN